MSVDEAKAAISAAQKVLDGLKKEQQDAFEIAQKATKEAAAVQASTGRSAAKAAPVPIPSAPAPAAAPAAASNAKMKATIATKDTRSPAEIMAEINSLLIESQSAQAQLAAAREQCAVTVAASRTAVDAVNAAEKEKERLAKQLSASTDTIHDQLQEVQEAGGGLSLESLAESIPTPPSAAAAAVHAPAPAPAPAPTKAAVLPPAEAVKSTVVRVPKTVTLTIFSSSVVAAGGHLDVAYELLSGDWDEDDALQLCAVAAPGSGEAGKLAVPMRMRSLYLPTEVDTQGAFETFEYTNTPEESGTKVNPAYTGTTKVHLPAWACHVQVNYVRTTTTVVGEGQLASVKRNKDILAQTDILSITAGVHPASPVGRGGGTPKRRGGGVLPNTAKDSPEAINMLLELQKNINTFALSASINDIHPNSAVLTRAMAWAVPSSSSASGDAFDAKESGVSEEWTKVYIEVDVCHYSAAHSADGDASAANEFTCAKSVQTLMLATHLPLPVSQLEWTRSQVEIETSGRLSVRIPHLPPLVSHTPSAAAAAHSIAGVIVDEDEGVECLFCGNLLIETAAVKEARSLPSGMFDNIMHEFVCSEDISALTLTTSDMVTPVGQLLEGPVHVTVNPANVRASALTISCKAAPTLIDLFSGQGSALASAPISANGPGGAVVNIDTCVLNCARCLMYLGDGQLASDGDDCACPVHDPDASNTDKGPSAAAQEQELELTDLVDIRFARSSVAVPWRLLQPTPLAPGTHGLAPGLTSEQSLARTLVHLQGSLGVSAFIVSVPQPMMSSSAASTRGGDAILLRLMSKEYGVTQPVSNPRCSPAVKISFRVASRYSIGNTGAETRIPLHTEEFREVCTLLETRSHLFGASIFKDQKLGYLYL